MEQIKMPIKHWHFYLFLRHCSIQQSSHRIGIISMKLLENSVQMTTVLIHWQYFHFIRPCIRITNHFILIDREVVLPSIAKLI